MTKAILRELDHSRRNVSQRIAATHGHYIITARKSQFVVGNPRNHSDLSILVDVQLTTRRCRSVWTFKSLNLKIPRSFNLSVIKYLEKKKKKKTLAIDVSRSLFSLLRYSKGRLGVTQRRNSKSRSNRAKSLDRWHSSVTIVINWTEMDSRDRSGTENHVGGSKPLLSRGETKRHYRGRVSTRVARATTMSWIVVGVSTGDWRAVLTSSLRDARGCFTQPPRSHEKAGESSCPRHVVVNWSNYCWSLCPTVKLFDLWIMMYL